MVHQKLKFLSFMDRYLPQGDKTSLEWMESKVFNFSLIVSALVHILILASMFFANIHSSRLLQKRIEIVYRTQEVETQVVKETSPAIKSLDTKQWMPKPEVLSRTDSAPTSHVGNISKQPVPFSAHKKDPSRFQALQGKRHVAIPLLRSEKISNPQYLSYHDKIRNKIKNRAYFYVENPEFEEGEVYLTFVLESNGNLRQTKIIDDKTRANNYLRNVGLRSIKESSPFPSFPSDLNYPELSFNVIISFEINQ